MLARAVTQQVNLQINELFMVGGEGRHQISQDRLTAPLRFG